MKKTVWRNKSNGQLCITVPSSSGIKEGDLVDLEPTKIRRITYSSVVGDMFHYGHLHSLQFAKSLSDYNICGVLTDSIVEEYRVKPIANLKERKAIFSSLNCVDRAMIQNKRDPTENLKKIHEEFPDAEIILIHGADLNYVHGSDYIKKIGGKVIKHPYYERLSTVKIINQLMENKDKFKDITDLASLIGGKEKVDTEYERGNKTIISTKADTLSALKPLLKKSRIEDLFVFTFSDWKNNKKTILSDINKKFSSEKIIIRSSAINEDTLDKSMAGCFDSVLNVDPSNEKEIESAIKTVINSYKNKTSESSFNQILVQSQTKDTIMSGVIFTRTLEKSSPYYVINYDDSTGETDTVTKGVENKTIKISRFANSTNIPRNMQALLSAVKEIESIIPKLGLDIEFAIDNKGQIIIFQVRPLTTSLKLNNNDSKIKEKIKNLKIEFNSLSKKKTHLANETTILADMPDWNPAEIIGDNPNYLDYSLYDYIITNSAWHEARTSQGYYNVDPAKLVTLLGNKPYIDVRNSFNSFIPNSLSRNLHDNLVSFYLKKLNDRPELQDKIEFDIVYTCYDLSYDERSKELLNSNFKKEAIIELKNALINLTNNLILTSKESIKDDLSSIKKMENDREKIAEKVKSTNITIESLLKNSKFLLDDCRKKGTVQFSRLARLGFIGKIILKSLIKKGIIDQNFYDNFMGSISTVATDINEDFKHMASGNITQEEFIKKYYHLRPGSYDITSLRYESHPDLIRTMHLEIQDSPKSNFSLTTEQDSKITLALKKEGLKFNAKTLLEFARKSLESREYAKFEFTKNLSDAIELIALAGEEMGFTRQELSVLDVNEIFSKTKQTRNQITKGWKEIISNRSNERETNNQLILPPIICSEKDIEIIRYYSPKPNYITQKKVRAPLVKINSHETIPDIEGKVVMIENGDPGYDWIFTRNLSGLITKYGGVASHMSIRCAEFGIPAAIGCGVLFDQLSNVEGVILDCKSNKLIPIKGDTKCT